MDRQRGVSWLGRATVVVLGGLVVGGAAWLAAWLLLGAALGHWLAALSLALATEDLEMGENRYRRAGRDQVC